MRPLAAAFALAAIVSGCSGLPTATTRLTEASHDMNNALRFGNTGGALERVTVEARADFIKRHAKWGQTLRILDVEGAGASFRRKDIAEVFLTITWQRIDESTVRTTRLVQRWKDDGGWKMANEQRLEGAMGLFGEPEPRAPEPAAAPPTAQQARFKTHVIYEE
jgi:hypothetical protein